MNNINKKCSIEKVFKAIEIYKQQQLQYEEFFDIQDLNINVKDENDNYVKINKIITKQKSTVKLEFNSGIKFHVAQQHLIQQEPGKDCVIAKNIQFLTDINGKRHDIKKRTLIDKKQKVYDFEINSNTHLYQTANGFINHNTGKSLLSDIVLGENIKKGKGYVSYKAEIEDAGGGDFTSQIVGGKEISDQIRIITPNVTKAVKKAKGDTKKLNQKDLVITVERLTSFINKIADWQISKGKDKLPSIVISIDSLSQLTSDKEIQDVADEKEKRDMTAQQQMRRFFRALNPKLKAANLTLVGIAHLTTNIGMVFGNPKVISAKGSGPKYGSSLTLNCISSKQILDPKSEIPIGIRMKIKITKNRIKYKGRSAFVNMYFNRGIDPFGGLSELLLQFGLVKSSAKPKSDGSLEQSAKISYTTLDGKELKWKLNTCGKIIENNGGIKLLEEMNTRLNDLHKIALDKQGINEDELKDVETDSLEDLENEMDEFVNEE